MRNAFAAELTRLAGENDQLVMLSGDIGNRLFDDFKAHFPNRFYNCGVAEANMISMAAGLAMEGLHPVAYTITPFITTRCFEQIRVDVCYHNVPVVIVGVGAGLSYATLGPTHHSCEDIAIMRALPNMTVIAPGDPLETRLALRAAMQHNGPVYIRMGKKGEPVIHQQTPDFEIGKALIIQNGKDVCLLGTGTILPDVLKAADLLADKGISAQVVSFPTIKPLDETLLADVFSRFSVVTTIEEHSRLGGFGSSVAEWLTDQAPMEGRLCRIGTNDTFMDVAGEQEYARQHFGLDAHSICEKTLQMYHEGVLS